MKILVLVSLLEAALIKKLREYDFGEFKVIKQDKEPRRVVIGGSEYLKEEDGMTLDYGKDYGKDLNLKK